MKVCLPRSAMWHSTYRVIRFALQYAVRATSLIRSQALPTSRKDETKCSTRFGTGVLTHAKQL